MKLFEPLPRALQAARLVTIPLPDGVTLSARLWLPELAPGETVPAIVDCHPYRLTDGSAVRDARVYRYYAAHGYGCLRVDLRGSGNSGGVLRDEYLPQEQQDGVAVIAWLAAQPWCSGSVGWTGISWGGFAGLQVAAQRPPALKALITICSTDDRYADDVHYRGGCLLASEMLPWASTMLLLNALPPDPVVVGASWRALWQERLDGSPPFIEAWLRHQLRDEYWRQGSVCEDFGAISAPTLIVGGWADGYVDAALRLLAGLSCPRKAIIGPWGHGSPHEVEPRPNIGFLQESLRWWDRWLKGIETGVEDEPALRAWMQESMPPATFYAERPGRWLGLAWPPPTTPLRSYLVGVALAERAGAGEELQHRGGQAQGFDAGDWCPTGSPGDWPPDQRAEDGASLAFSSPPLAAPLELLGNAAVRLEVAVDTPSAEIVVRLCAVAPDGASLLVSRGVLNLTHRHGHAATEPLTPAAFVTVDVPLKAVAQSVPTGHRLRLSIGTTYWPWLWPSPEPVTLRLRCGAESYLTLPVLPDNAPSLPVRFAEPEQAHGDVDATVLEIGRAGRSVQRDLTTGETILTAHSRGPLLRLADGLEFGRESEETFSINDAAPLSARVSCRNSAVRRRGDWQIRVETESEMTATRETFLVSATVRGYEAERLVHTRDWRFAIPRL